jgi:hypothetical protein
VKQEAKTAFDPEDGGAKFPSNFGGLSKGYTPLIVNGILNIGESVILTYFSHNRYANRCLQYKI